MSQWERIQREPDRQDLYVHIGMLIVYAVAIIGMCIAVAVK